MRVLIFLLGFVVFAGAAAAVECGPPPPVVDEPAPPPVEPVGDPVMAAFTAQWGPFKIFCEEVDPGSDLPMRCVVLDPAWRGEALRCDAVGHQCFDEAGPL